MAAPIAAPAASADRQHHPQTALTGLYLVCQAKPD
jgi:hypothetical protein